MGAGRRSAAPAAKAAQVAAEQGPAGTGPGATPCGAVGGAAAVCVAVALRALR